MSRKERTVQTEKIKAAIKRCGVTHRHMVEVMMIIAEKHKIKLSENGFTKRIQGEMPFEPELAKPLAQLLTTCQFEEDEFGDIDTVIYTVTPEDVLDWFGIATADV